MKNIAIIFIIVGIIIALFSNFLVFKPLKKYIDNENINDNNDNNDNKEDFIILINSTKKIIYILCIIFIIIGILLYYLSSNI